MCRSRKETLQLLLIRANNCICVKIVLSNAENEFLKKKTPGKATSNENMIKEPDMEIQSGLE